jgi:hypothetical protein
MTTDLLSVWSRTRGDGASLGPAPWRSWAVALIMLATVTLGAQERPDFSGRWVLTGRPSGKDIPSALTVRQSRERSASGSALTGSPVEGITIDRQFESGTTSETHTIGLVGGVVPGRRAGGTPAGPTGHHRVQWEGSSLVFEHGDYTGEAGEGGAWTERREVWSLQPDERLRVVITVRGSVDRPADVALMYHRPARGPLRASRPS